MWKISKQTLFDGIKLYVPLNHSQNKRHKHSIPKHIKIMTNKKRIFGVYLDAPITKI